MCFYTILVMAIALLILWFLYKQKKFVEEINKKRGNQITSGRTIDELEIILSTKLVPEITDYEKALINSAIMQYYSYD